MTNLVKKTITLPCAAPFLHEARQVLKEALAATTLPDRERDLVILAVDEAASSLVRYAKHKGHHQNLTLAIDIDDVRFKASLVDSLNVFEFGPDLTDAQLADRIREERAYTLSLFLIRAIMDEVTYVYRKGFQNDLELIKFL